MRHTRSHTKNRRSHHALQGSRLSTAEGGVKHPRHKALLDGTPYKGRVVMDQTVKRTKKEALTAQSPQEDSAEKKESKNTEE